MAKMLADRIAVVTGGDSGIGAACVTALAAQGARVASISYHDAAGSPASAEAARQHGRAEISLQADVGNEREVHAAFDAVAGQLGLPDILVNSAGVNMAGIAVTAMELAS